MTWTAPKTWTVGEVLTAADLNEQLRDNMLSMGWVKLYEEELASSQATFDITSIPATFKDLRLVIVSRGTTALTQMSPRIRFNNDSGSNYDYNYESYDAGGVARGIQVAQAQGFIGQAAAASAPSGHSGMSEVIIPRYAGTAFHKLALFRAAVKFGTAVGDFRNDEGAAWWRSTAAINRLTITPSAGDFDVGSRIALYGSQ